MARILIIDDEDGIRSSLRSALDKRGHDVVTAATYREGFSFSSANFDLVLLDVFLPDGNGVDLLAAILARHPKQLVVMISGHADVDTAVKAIRLGAYDFIEKPLSLDRILITVDNAAKAGRLVTERDRLANLVYGDLVGDSSGIRKVKESIERSAPKTNRFLILGENGTGKELVAHLIHRRSKNAEGPFIAVNCAALPSELVESELFGHTQGAFTGATQARKGRFLEAHTGTIFLDEISEMSTEVQAKILRVLETREVSPVGSDKTLSVDCIVIAASNRNLDELVAEGRFREDLYYRLNVVAIVLPPLRERRDDIPTLADHFLQKFARESGGETKRLAPEALTLVSNLHFAGNIRELKNLMERAHIYCDGLIVSADSIRPLLPLTTAGKIRRLKEVVDEFELQYINSALDRNNGNMAETARQLGLERSHLYKKLRRQDPE